MNFPDDKAGVYFCRSPRVVEQEEGFGLQGADIWKFMCDNKGLHQVVYSCTHFQESREG